MNKKYIFDLYIKKNFTLFILLDILEWNAFIMREMRIFVVVDIFILEWSDFVIRELQIPVSSSVIIWWNKFIIINMYIKIWFV